MSRWRYLRRWEFAACMLVVVGVAGYSLGQHSSRQRSAVNVPAAPAVPSQEAAHIQSTQSVMSARASASSPLTADWQALDGNAFVVALPELERRARDGDADAIRLVFNKLQECASYTKSSDDEIHQRIDEWYRHQLDSQASIAKKNPDFLKDHPEYATTEATRRQALQHEFDTRDRCTALTGRQIEVRFDVARAALARHDRALTIALSTIGGLQAQDAELVRNADQLIELRDSERVELNRLVETGDLDALARSAYGYSNESSMPNDPTQAYAYAYAYRLADNGEDKWGMQRLMDNLVGDRLSPDQVDEARKRGDALYQRCCKAGIH